MIYQRESKNTKGDIDAIPESDDETKTGSAGSAFHRK